LKPEKFSLACGFKDKEENMRFKYFRIKTASAVLGTLFLLSAAFGLRAGVVPDSPEKTRPLQAGAEAPMGELKDAQGNDFDLKAAFEKQPTVLVVYRGNW